MVNLINGGGIEAPSLGPPFDRAAYSAGDPEDNARAMANQQFNMPARKACRSFAVGQFYFQAVNGPSG